MQTSVTRYAITGAVFGVVSLPIWAAFTHVMSIRAGAGVGLLAGVAGGVAAGLVRSLLRR
jgi:hypothetical protein